MKYNLAFKYRIYPNKEQELLINKPKGGNYKSMTLN